jgi:hypothetical protein
MNIDKWQEDSKLWKIRKKMARGEWRCICLRWMGVERLRSQAETEEESGAASLWTIRLHAEAGQLTHIETPR